jgi:putative transposase
MADQKSNKSIVACTVKLKLRPAQERMLIRWLWHLTGVYNWAIKKIERCAAIGIYHSRYDIEGMLSGHSRTIGIPARVIEGSARTAHQAWRRCFDGLASRPRLKGQRNRLNSILFREDLHLHAADIIHLTGIGKVRFHKQDIPFGRITQARLIRRSSGWYLALSIEADPIAIPLVALGEVGIDPGFSRLLTCSSGEVVERPHELAAIYWSTDSHQAIARIFGKSVASAAHGQLRQFLDYKSRAGGRRFVAVSNRYSTVTCSACGARSGPSGYAGLKVRQWRCGCGANHDRDVNAAVNTLLVGRGLRLEGVSNVSSEIAN